MWLALAKKSEVVWHDSLSTFSVWRQYAATVDTDVGACSL